jgi:hypothetical protein
MLRNSLPSVASRRSLSAQPGFPLLSFPRTVSGDLTVFIPIYPNRLPIVPKPSGACRMWSILIKGLGASRSATTRLENR